MYADDMISKRLISNQQRSSRMFIQKKKHSVLTVIHNVLCCHGVCVHHQIGQLSAELHGLPSATQPVKYTPGTHDILELEGVWAFG